MPNLSLPFDPTSFKDIKKELEKLFLLLDAAERRSMDNKELTYLLLALDKILRPLSEALDQLAINTVDKAALKEVHEIMNQMPSKWTLEEKLAFLKLSSKLSTQQVNDKEEAAKAKDKSWLGSYEDYCQKYGYQTGNPDAPF